MKRCNSRTVVVCSTAALPPLTVTMGQGTYPALNLMLNLIRAKTRRLIAFDGLALARKAGSPLALNMVLLGALIRTGVLPLKTDQIKQAIAQKTPPALQDINNQAFELGFAAGVQAEQD